MEVDGFWIKKTNVRRLRKYFFKKASIHHLQKLSKSTAPNTRICDKIHLTRATSRNLST